MLFGCSFLAMFTVFSSCLGFMFDDPCNVYPHYSGGIPDSHDFTTSVSVPASCRNGTFRWDYPKGHTMLQFQNVRQETISICIRDNVGGDVFTKTDTTTNKRVGHFDYDHWACTDPVSTKIIVLRVDAPFDQRYVGAFEYRIQNR